jgi:RNA polymerase sigma-70 factor (ECF subfamily)
LNGASDAEPDPLAALRDGDPGPFEAFVRAETPTLLAFFLRLGAGRAEAEDLTQDTFLKLFRHAPQYRAQDRFAPYALRVARNAWIDRRRRASVRPAPAAGGEAEDERPEVNEPVERRGPFELASAGEERRRVTDALAALPDHHRLVFELGVLQELPYAEIADALDIPVGTVKSRMFHALRRLRAELARDDGPRDGTGEEAFG